MERASWYSDRFDDSFWPSAAADSGHSFYTNSDFSAYNANAKVIWTKSSTVDNIVYCRGRMCYSKPSHERFKWGNAMMVLVYVFISFFRWECWAFDAGWSWHLRFGSLLFVWRQLGWFCWSKCSPWKLHSHLSGPYEKLCIQLQLHICMDTYMLLLYHMDMYTCRCACLICKFSECIVHVYVP